MNDRQEEILKEQDALKKINLIFSLVKRWGKMDESLLKKSNRNLEGNEPLSDKTVFFPVYAPQDLRAGYGSIGKIHCLIYDPVANKKFFSYRRSNDDSFFCTPFNEHYACNWDYKVDDLLKNVLSTAIMEKQIDPKNWNFNNNRNEVKRIIKEKNLSGKGILSSNKSKNDLWEVAAKGSFNDTIFSVISHKISDIIEKKYGGKLDLPSSIALIGRKDVALEESNIAWMICCDSIKSGSNLNLCMGRESDMVTADGAYGIDFLQKLCDLVGGPHFELNERMNKVYMTRIIDMTQFENLPKTKAIDKLFTAYEGEIPYTGKLHGITGYVTDKLIRDRHGYSAEYHIIDPEAKENPTLFEHLTDEDIEKMSDSILRQVALENEKLANRERRFPYFHQALEDLMPNVYEEIVFKNKLNVKSLDDVLAYYSTKEQIESQRGHLQERQEYLAERKGEKVSSPLETTTHDSTSPTPTKPNGRDDGGR